VPAEGNQLLPSDDEPATFWVTNPANDLVGNVAAGSEAIGFWYALPEHPIGLSESPENDARVWPRQTPLGLFANNVTHSNGFRGLTVDDGPDPAGYTESANFEPRLDPTDAGSGFVTAVFERLVAYKNRERGVWLRGTSHILSKAVLADNGIGATFASYESYLVDSLVIGETGNAGSASYKDEPRGAHGRSLPMPWDPGFAITGFEFYDGIVGVRDTVFAGFFPNRVRNAHALGFNRDNAFALDPRSFATGLTFLDTSTRVHTAPSKPAFDGDKMRLFQDLDGSVTGRAGVSVVANQPLLHDGECARRSEWNGYVCGGRYAALSVSNLAIGAVGLGPVVVRQPDDSWVELAGIGGMVDYAPTDYIMNVRPDHRYEVFPRGQSPAVRISLDYGEPGEWVLVTLAWHGEAPFVYREDEWTEEDRIVPVDSVAELAASDGDAYLYDSQRGLVTVKLQVPDGDIDATRDICARADCT
jgi:cell migration-inducing and hyaluronan-binding protein